MSNDAADDRLADILAKLQDQLTDIAAMQTKQAAVTLGAQAADGTVEVTVNARGQLVKTVIDQSYLDDHDFDDLGDYITEAAQAAARDAAGRMAEMLAPINERHSKFPTFSEIINGSPDLRDLVPPGLDLFTPGLPRREGSAATSTGGFDDDGGTEGEFPTVKR